MRRHLPFIIVAVLFGLSVAPANAQATPTPQHARYERVIRELAIRDKATVELKLRDGSKLKGVIRTVGVDSFMIAEGKPAVERTITFDDVEFAKKPRNGLKLRTWAIISGAAAAAVIISVTVLYPLLCDGGAGCH